MKDARESEGQVDSEASPEDVWATCLSIINDNVPKRSFKTWFEPLRAVSLESEDGLRKLTVQLPSRFYYEWLEEHYFGLLRKTVTKVLGPGGRLFYDIVIERDDAAAGSTGASMHLPARPAPAGEAPAGPDGRSTGGEPFDGRRPVARAGQHRPQNRGGQAPPSQSIRYPRGPAGQGG
jgi:chromosomal replication initiator protein